MIRKIFIEIHIDRDESDILIIYPNKSKTIRLKTSNLDLLYLILKLLNDKEF